MSALLALTFHYVGFGLLAFSLVCGIVLEFHQRAIHQTEQKRRVYSLIQNVGYFFLLSSLFLLFTGTALIFYRIGDTLGAALAQVWLAAKIMLFSFLLVNSLLVGVLLHRKRIHLVKSVLDEVLPNEVLDSLKIHTRNIVSYYILQSFLLFVILILSAYGSLHH